MFDVCGRAPPWLWCLAPDKSAYTVTTILQQDYDVTHFLKQSITTSEFLCQGWGEH
jgi:hypothetical protein